MSKRWVKVVIGVVLGVVLAAILLWSFAQAGAWVYIHWIKDDAPKVLGNDDALCGAPAATTPTGATTPTPATGAIANGNTWTVAAGSQVGYRVVEGLLGQDTEGVGRTSTITGSLTLEGAMVSQATFVVDMNSLVSDDARRDSKFSGQIMEAATFPTSTFTLTQPIDLGSVPAECQEITASATGTMELHGVTNPVTFDVTAKRSGGVIAISGSFDIAFADYGIANPSNAAVTTQDHGLIEFALAFAQG